MSRSNESQPTPRPHPHSASDAKQRADDAGAGAGADVAARDDDDDAVSEHPDPAACLRDLYQREPCIADVASLSHLVDRKSNAATRLSQKFCRALVGACYSPSPGTGTGTGKGTAPKGYQRLEEDPLPPRPQLLRRRSTIDLGDESQGEEPVAESQEQNTPRRPRSRRSQRAVPPVFVYRQAESPASPQIERERQLWNECHRRGPALPYAPGDFDAFVDYVLFRTPESAAGPLGCQDEDDSNAHTTLPFPATSAHPPAASLNVDSTADDCSGQDSPSSSLPPEAGALCTCILCLGTERRRPTSKGTWASSLLENTPLLDAPRDGDGADKASDQGAAQSGAFSRAWETTCGLYYLRNNQRVGNVQVGDGPLAQSFDDEHSPFSDRYAECRSWAHEDDEISEMDDTPQQSPAFDLHAFTSASPANDYSPLGAPHNSTLDAASPEQEGAQDLLTAVFLYENRGSFDALRRRVMAQRSEALTEARIVNGAVAESSGGSSLLITGCRAPAQLREDERISPEQDERIPSEQDERNLPPTPDLWRSPARGPTARWHQSKSLDCLQKALRGSRVSTSTQTQPSSPASGVLKRIRSSLAKGSAPSSPDPLPNSPLPALLEGQASDTVQSKTP